MAKECITTEVKDNILIITFNSLALNGEVFTQLNAALDEAEAYKGVVIQSSNDKIFLAGADLYELDKIIKAGDKELAREVIQRGQDTFTRIEKLRVPVVAAIKGMALGGGCELALACDYRIASSDKNTKIGLPEVNLGILPAWGGTTRLPRLVGMKEALTGILAGKLYAAKPALRAKLVNEVCHPEHLLTKAIAAAKKKKRSSKARSWIPNAVLFNVAKKNVLKKTNGNYPAPLKIIEVLKESIKVSPKESFEMEQDAFIELCFTDECKSLLRIFFMQETSKKLLADKTKPQKITNAMVVGAGTMGAGIAQWLTSRGVNVLLKDVNDESINRGLKQIGSLYVQGVRKYKFDRPAARDGLAKLTSTTNDVPLNKTELVIEAIVEKLDVKQKVLAEIEKGLSDDAIIATNTSALSIDDMAKGLKHPERLVGIHFFNPVHQMKLVEVVKGKQTSKATVKKAVQFVQQISKLPVVVKDSPGFVVNRVLVPYLVKAAEKLSDGFDIESIDKAMIDFGMPMGPFRLMDEIGLDVCYHVAKDLEERLNIQSDGVNVLEKYIDKGELGKKSNKGFYTYKKGKAVRNGTHIDGTPIARLLVDEMVLESKKIVKENVVEDGDALDFAMIMGTGWAPFRGGPLYHSKNSLTSV